MQLERFMQNGFEETAAFGLSDEMFLEPFLWTSTDSEESSTWALWLKPQRQ
jgi:hypothetical protein